MFRDQVQKVLNQTNPKQFLKRRAAIYSSGSRLSGFFFYICWRFISKKANRCCGIVACAAWRFLSTLSAVRKLGSRSWPFVFQAPQLRSRSIDH